MARNELERAARLKDEFLATLSHELRTPLNAMLGWIQVLRRSPADAPTIGKGLETIERNIRVQGQLIEDLLDMSRIVSGKLRLNVQEVQLPAVIESALDTVRPAAEAKAIELIRSIEPLTEPVLGDAHRLQQIVWNLLSNAIKFTPAGGRVSVALRKLDDQAQLVIEDNGKGVEPDFLPHLFERFRQADASPSRDFGGLGLGLSIVKHLTELHGGGVQAYSEGEGRGTKFTVQLPVARAPTTEHPQSAVRPTDSRFQPLDDSSVKLAGVTVMVVDDNSDARELIERVLKDCGAETVLAASADEAQLLLRSHSPDILLSDIGMPRKDGYQLMLELRKSGLTIPSIALTAFARPEDRTRALTAGFQMHIAKPVEPRELIAAVASLVRTLRLLNRAREGDLTNATVHPGSNS
jgi:CheY-like chemotaxis protein/two-component sensor histidine kinase